jgi:hypothetical protein
MAIAHKAELHRLVDAIPEARPELVEALMEVGLRLLVASRSDELLYRRLHRELVELQTSAGDRTELSTRTQELQSRWLDELGAPTVPLPLTLANAPIDDEPLTAEEIAILNARRGPRASGAPHTHDQFDHACRA